MRQAPQMRRNRIHFRLAITITFLCFAGLFMPALAQGRVYWDEGGVVLCESTAAGGLCAVPDGSGGAIVAWADHRGRHESVWARRIDHSGSPRWQTDGVQLRGETWSPLNLSACSDREGGMIASWTESYAGPYAAQVTAQRVDTAGNIRWGPTGVVVAGSDGDRDYYASLVSDGRGGAIVVWLRFQLQPERLDSLCIQRLDSLGRPCWGPIGVLVSADTLLWTPPYLCTDRHGGAYSAWSQVEGPTILTYVQHVDSTGLLSWPPGGLPVCSTSTSLVSGLGIGDADSGCVVAFAKEGGIWAQRFEDDGGMLWGPHGTCVVSSVGGVWDLEVREAEGLGFFCAWSENRRDTYDILAQCLDREGVRLWDTAGLAVGTTGSGEGHGLAVVPGGREDLIVAWPSLRRDNWDIVAQRIDSEGTLCWAESGLAVVDDTLKQYWEPAIVTDQRQGAVVFWDYSFATPQGYRSGVNAQRIGDATAINEDHSVVGPTATCYVRPSPARGPVFIHVDHLDARDFIEVVAANGAVVRRLGSSAGRREPLIWNCRDASGRKVPAGVYLCRETRSSRALGKIVLVPK